MKGSRQELGSPCATCPFLRANFGKPNPEGYDPQAAAEKYDADFYDWYSERNLRRLWAEGIRKGEPMICHATDPTAHTYGGKAVEPGSERPCIGALTIVLRHLKCVDGNLGASPSQTIKAYRAAAGKYPMTREGILNWAMMVNVGRTGLMGGLVIPKSLSAEAVEQCGVPWKDKIVNGKER